MKLLMCLIEHQAIDIWYQTEVRHQLHALAALSPQTDASRCWIGGWVKPRAKMDAMVKRKISCPGQHSKVIP